MLTLWLTPLWLFALGVTVGLVVLAVLFGLLWLINRKAAEGAWAAIRESVLMPVLWIAAILVALFAFAFPQMPSDRVLDVRWERLVSKLEPGARERWTAIARFRGASAREVEMVATLYDASLDALHRHSWPTSLDWLFRRNEFETRAMFANQLSASSHDRSRPYPDGTASK